MELKDCPHCGGKATLRAIKMMDEWKVFVSCDICGCRTRSISNGDEDPSENEWDTTSCDSAVYIWNYRVEK